MTLNVEEIILLEKMFNASIAMSAQSGIPIGKEHYDTIDSLRKKLREEYCEAFERREKNGK